MSDRIAEWQIGEEITGRSTVFDDVQGGADNHGRNAILFEMSCGQTHGLMANGSERDEEGNVSPILLQPFQYLGCIDINGLTLAVFRWHAVETICQATQSTCADFGL